MDLNLKLTRMEDVALPERATDKIQRELCLILAGSAGLKTGAKESLYEHPIETASQLALGLGVNYLSRGKGACSRLARGAGTFMGLSFANDVLRNGDAICDALTDNWQSSNNWQHNVGVMERSLGRFAFDTILFAGAGAAFESCLPLSSVKNSVAKPGESVDSQSVHLVEPRSSKCNIQETISQKRNLIDRAVEYFGKGERNPPILSDGPQEVSQYLGLQLPALSEQQTALAHARILDLIPDGRGSMRHEKYRAHIEFEDGSSGQAIVRAFPHGWAYTRRYRLEQSAYHLNRAMQFENGFPVTAPRTYERNGRLYRGWIQEERGIPLEFGLRDLAEQTYGQGSYENVALLTRENQRIHCQVEQAFIERLILADTDPHSKNMVLTPELRIQNIDLDCAFHGNYEPGLTSSHAYGINHMLLMNLERRAISDATLSKLDCFLHRYDSASGKMELHGFGLESGEIRSLMHRTKWFAKEGQFPEFHSLEL